MAGLRSRIKIPGVYLLVLVFSGLILLLFTSNSFPRDKVASLRVLCYHSFVGSSNRYSFSLKELEAHIQLLLRKGYTFIGPEDFLDQTYRGQGNILVTIDDGHRSVHDAYFKVLKKYNIKPVLAIYPAVIGCTGYGLTWEQLRELVDDGCGIASHGYSHYQLNDRLYEKNRKLFNREVIDSKKLLEKKLERDVKIFIYPYGVYSESIFHDLSHAGYNCAFTVRDGPVSPEKMTGNSFSLPRYMLTRHNSMALLDNVPSYAVASESSADKKIEWIPYYKDVRVNNNKAVLKKEEPFFVNRIKFEIVQPGIDYIKRKVSRLKHDDLISFSLYGKNSKEIISAKPGLDISAMLSNNGGQLKVDSAHLQIKNAAKELLIGSAKAYNQFLGYCDHKVRRLNDSLSSVISKDSIKKLIDKSILEQFKDKYLKNK